MQGCGQHGIYGYENKIIKLVSLLDQSEVFLILIINQLHTVILQKRVEVGGKAVLKIIEGLCIGSLILQLLSILL